MEQRWPHAISSSQHVNVSWGDFPFSSYPKLVSAGQAQRYQSWSSLGRGREAPCCPSGLWGGAPARVPGGVGVSLNPLLGPQSPPCFCLP